MKNRIHALKKGLNAVIRIRVSTLMAILFVAVSCVTAMAAATTKITATLSPDVTVKYNGVVQTMRDGNGAVVYPLLYKGTTYIPVRAVSNMLGIAAEWDGKTRTVLLGSPGNSSVGFQSIVTKQSGNGNGSWSFTTNRDELPSPHTAALKPVGVYRANEYIKTVSVFEIKPGYKTLSFKAFCTDGVDPKNKGVTITVTNADSGVELWSHELGRGKSVNVTGIDISGVKRLKFAASVIYGTVGADVPLNPVYLCDPVVK